MRMDNKALALLTAAILSTGLIACERAGEDKSASSQGSSAPMGQAPSEAPKQGYTGPATPSAPAGTAGEEKSGQPAEQTGSPSSDPMKKQPENPGQETPQR